ncbi:AfsR/SARP family transcriptional regulator [Streptomyces brasiliensis]|uniref:AfsR/SARP family transcriptional regulator n=1 Tax=Streptomyces brasiliensis TaxID=1954 RepID=UPI001E3D9B2A|nr:helix-turn-helix domain-containing protein [Streptomyces brasiliensis]
MPEPVRAWRDDTEPALGPPKQQGLLAPLLTQAGHPCSVHEIVDALWGQDPPDSAVDVVQRHIGALRRLLEPDLPARGRSRWLVRGSGGYRLDVETDALDLLRFRDLASPTRPGLRGLNCGTVPRASTASPDFVTREDNSLYVPQYFSVHIHAWQPWA